MKPYENNVLKNQPVIPDANGTLPDEIAAMHNRLLADVLPKPLNETESDTLNFIRANVRRQIERNELPEPQKPGKIITLTSLIAAAAVILIIAAAPWRWPDQTNTTSNTTSGQRVPAGTDNVMGELTSVDDSEQILRETVHVLTRFNEFENSTPNVVIQLSVQETQAILRQFDVLKIQYAEQPRIRAAIQQIETYLIAISAINMEGENGKTEIDLIQQSMKQERLIEKLAGI